MAASDSTASYRDAACEVEASEYSLCVADQNRRHAQELAGLERELRTER